MRPVTLYTLKAEAVMVSPLQDYIHNVSHRHSYSIFDDFKVLTTEGGKPSALYNTDTCRINKVVKHIAKTGARPWHVEEDYEREEIYFAVEPALAEILEAPYKAQVEEVNRKLEKGKQDLKHALSIYADCQRRINTFKELPWYKRVWKAFRGRI